MARKSRRTAQKPRAPYTCPHCDKSFAGADAENSRSIALHRIMHVDDSGERWKLVDDFISKETGGAPTATTRTQAG
jgi:hypothetical protein